MTNKEHPKITPIYMPLDHEISEDDRTRLNDMGFEIIKVTDPNALIQNVSLMSLPVPGDVMTKCLLSAVQGYKPSREKFSELILAAMIKTTE